MASLHNGPTGDNLFEVAYDKSWKAPVHQCSSEAKEAAMTTYTLHIKNNSITATPEMQIGGRRACGVAGKNPSSVARRNARERRRIRNVNSAFDELRQHVPNGERNRKKISKVETLQSAIEYIKALEEELVRKRRSKTTAPAEGDKENAPKLNKCTRQNEQSPTQVDTPEYEENSMESDDVIFVKELNAQICEQSEAEATVDKQRCAAESGKKVQRPTALTESMLKAFDVMIQKCASERKASTSHSPDSPDDEEKPDNEEQTKTLCQDSSSVASNFPSNHSTLDIQSPSRGSVFSELFVDGIDEQTDSISERSFRPRQSSLELDQTPPTMDFAASPILLDNFPTSVADNSQGGFLQQLQNITPVFEQTSTQDVPNFDQRNSPVECYNQQGNTDYFQQPITTDQWPSKNEIDSFDEPFDVQTAAVSSALDQINPTLDFSQTPNDNFSFVEATPIFMNMAVPSMFEQQAYGHAPFSAPIESLAAAAQW